MYIFTSVQPFPSLSNFHNNLIMHESSVHLHAEVTNGPNDASQSVVPEASPLAGLSLHQSSNCFLVEARGHREALHTTALLLGVPKPCVSAGFLESEQIVVIFSTFILL